MDFLLLLLLFGKISLSSEKSGPTEPFLPPRPTPKKKKKKKKKKEEEEEQKKKHKKKQTKKTPPTSLKKGPLLCHLVRSSCSAEGCKEVRQCNCENREDSGHAVRPSLISLSALLVAEGDLWEGTSVCNAVPVSQPTSQSVNQSASQIISQSVSHLVSQPVSQPVS